LLHGARGYEHNRFKIELATMGVIRALTVAAQGTSEVV
jgi:xanthine dehydrogenase YagS FAD-binding subunit